MRLEVQRGGPFSNNAPVFHPPPPPVWLLSTPTNDPMCKLCRNFYQLGWLTGTNGGSQLTTGSRLHRAIWCAEGAFEAV
ncbi:hypothetical protein PGT21_021213 [Puccinia graminis f. sp. tritici]|uniref:Uncharacterized protein n=1 Tax=Puccinia graminis f. sp. tritici TaxID=56615 RepID=A0A5B0PFE4_PUCGR|nr:hypothetical protein PGTUg99_032755 [Puccinia graminis f. sp. tritici]KAA1099803.1 hypothetical protein PGT21_021213 [Puccinia graminis f. sp. tritici]